MASCNPNNVTTDHIQQYLDENKSLILKIVESRNSGKLSECVENQARLQRNLVYLSDIADSQPEPLHSQDAQSGMVQSTPHYLQAQQAAQQMTPQSMMAARSSMLYSAQQQQQYFALQQRQSMLGDMSSSGRSHMMHHEANFSGTTGQLGGFADLRRMTGGGGGNKQDMDGRVGSSGSHGGGSDDTHQIVTKIG